MGDGKDGERILFDKGEPQLEGGLDWPDGATIRGRVFFLIYPMTRANCGVSNSPFTRNGSFVVLENIHIQTPRRAI